MSSQLIQAHNLSKVFKTGGEAEVHALRTVDIDINAGEFTVLMGSSGSGKSTLLYLLSGLEESTSGEITFDGRRVDTLDETELSLLRRSDLGFVFQAINLIPHLTLLENVAVPGYLMERDRKKVNARASALLERFGIGGLGARLPAQVSGGEQQRAAIARALINSPRAVLADEPTGALNSAAGRTVLEALREINVPEENASSHTGQSVIMATHEIRAACYGDRILYLKDGQVQSEYQHPDPDLPVEDREPALLDWLSGQGW